MGHLFPDSRSHKVKHKEVGIEVASDELAVKAKTVQIELDKTSIEWIRVFVNREIRGDGSTIDL